MLIRVTYNDDSMIKYDDFNHITDNMNVIKIDCSYNKLESLPRIDKLFPNLTHFYCGDNNLTSLPKMNFPNLEYFDCSHNKLTSLPIMNCPNLQYIYCKNNRLYSVPPHINCKINKDDKTKSPEYMRRKLLI